MSRVPTRRILVRNLSPSTKVDALRRVFSKYGEIREAHIPSSVNSRGQNFGFIEFSSVKEAETAFDILHNTSVEGYVLHVFSLYYLLVL